MRNTSIEAYKVICENGMLSILQMEVYKQLFEHGPATALEIASRIRDHNIDSVRPRFANLRDAGVIEEVGVKQCDVSGRKAIAWDVTRRLPCKQERKQACRTIRLHFAGGHHETYANVIKIEKL